MTYANNSHNFLTVACVPTCVAKRTPSDSYNQAPNLFTQLENDRCNRIMLMRFIHMFVCSLLYPQTLN